MEIDKIIAFLQNKIDNDDSLPEGIKVLEPYTYAHKVKSTEVQCEFISQSEFSQFTTFSGVEVSVCPLLINVYATQAQITKTVNDETVDELISAQRFSYMLAQKIVSWFKYAELNIEGVIGATNINYIPGRPFDTGTLLYQSVVRVDLYLEKI